MPASPQGNWNVWKSWRQSLTQGAYVYCAGRAGSFTHKTGHAVFRIGYEGFFIIVHADGVQGANFDALAAADADFLINALYHFAAVDWGVAARGGALAEKKAPGFAGRLLLRLENDASENHGY